MEEQPWKNKDYHTLNPSVAGFSYSLVATKCSLLLSVYRDSTADITVSAYYLLISLIALHISCGMVRPYDSNRTVRSSVTCSVIHALFTEVSL